jgi:hypothetical protein
MEEAAIIQYIADTFPGVDIVRPEAGDEPAIAVGDTFFIYDPDRDLAPERRFPFATIVTKDYGDFDCASNLNRPGVFRLNIGVSKETCATLFRTADGGDAGAEDGGVYDFAALDRVFPHPAYGKMHWVGVLNPSDTTFHEVIRPLMAEAYEIVVRRHSKKQCSAS